MNLAELVELVVDDDDLLTIDGDELEGKLCVSDVERERGAWGEIKGPVWNFFLLFCPSWKFKL